MANNRDDFSETTKRNAAKRVGYRCSFMGCHCPTVGASLGNKNKTSSIGVAAHICAASPEGPRYDPNMTKDERKDISNCIWMCQTHAHLIDTDYETYTVELLKAWKEEAERLAAEALANPNFINNYYATNSDNFDTIYQIFKNMIIEGEFAQLHILLDQYKLGQLSEKYDEFILRFRIILDAYCNRESLDNDIRQYCLLSSKYGIDELIELFISLSMKNELQRLIVFCNNEVLVGFAELIIDGKGETELFYSYNDRPELEIPEKYKELVYKAATNDTALKFKRNVVFIDQRGHECGLYCQEFYFHVITSVYNLGIKSTAELELDVQFDCDLLYIERNINKIDYFDKEIQEYTWSNFLNFISGTKLLFEKYYSKCPESIKTLDSVNKSKTVYLAQHDPKSINVDEVLALSERTDDYSVLSLVLCSNDRSISKKYLDDRRYLLAKSVNLLYDRIIVLNELSSNETITLLNNYSDVYCKSFLYHCLRAYCIDDKSELEITWLENNLSELKWSDVPFFCSVLEKHKKWDLLYSLSKRKLSDRNLFYISTLLANSQVPENLTKSKEIMENLIVSGYKEKGLKHNLGIINQNLGMIGEAKKCLQEEYDEYKEISTLKQYLAIRYESDEYIEDSYLLALSKVIDSESQNLVAATYLKLQKPQLAYVYFVRSLLLNDNQNLSINGLCQISNYSQTVEKCDSIKKDTVCVLYNPQSTIRIAIHSNGIIDGITPNQFAGCMHYSIEDPRVSALLFRTKEETVSFNGVEYVISSITPSKEEFSRYAFSELINRQDTKKIIGTAEESIEEITSILKSSTKELNRIIEDYNQSEFRIPISVLAKQLGKSMLITCEFLAIDNQEKIRNNLRNITCNQAANPIFVLSYESIIFLTHINIDLSLLENVDFACSNFVLNQLNNDINEELCALSSDSSFGVMSYSNEGIHFTKYSPEFKRNRHTYLNKLKCFIKRIKTFESNFDYHPHNQQWKEPFTKLILESKLLCESSSLGLAQNIKDSILVSDDQMIYNIASVESIDNIGLVGLLTFALTQWERLLEISKAMSKINFINYLPVFLYKKIVDSYSENAGHLKKGSQVIINWLSSDTDDEPSKYHDYIIIALFREIINNPQLHYLHSKPLISIALCAFERQNPGVIEKQIESAISDFKMLPVNETNDTEETE